MAYLQIDESASFDRLGTRLANIEHEINVRERFEQIIIPEAIRTEQIKLPDLLEVEISKTVNEAIGKLKDSLYRYEKIEQSRIANEQKQEQEILAQQQQGASQMQEDQHQKEIDKIVTKGFVDGAKETLTAKNSVVQERGNQIIQENSNQANQQPSQQQR